MKKVAYFGVESVAQFALEWVAHFGSESVAQFGVEWMAHFGSEYAIDIGNQQVALRKMFVHQNYRGRGTGTAHKLFESLLHWSIEKSVQGIYLGTTEKMYAAQRFYVNKGFAEINKTQLPDSFPIMEVDSKFYVLKMNQSGR